MLSPSILIVEDDPLNMQLMRGLLSSEGYELKYTNTAGGALEILAKFKPSLILTSMYLPAQSGLELARQVRGNPELDNTAIVVLTGSERKGLQETCLRAGCDGYIVKPIDVAAFAQAIRSYVAKRKPAVAAAQEDIRDLLRGMRNAFLVEVRAETTRLLNSQTPRDETALIHLLHRWAGVAGTLGLSAVTEVSRRVELFVLESHQPDSSQVREGLEEINRLLDAAAATQVADLPLPSNIVSGLSGKRVALAGFSTSEATRIAHAFDRAQSFTLTIEASPEGLSKAEVQRFDIVILNLCSQAGAACHKKTSRGLGKPILLVASRMEVSEDILTIDDPTRDFLIAPWDAEGLLVRCCKMLSHTPVSAPLPKRGGSHQIVIADDDATVSALLTAALRRTGAQCHIARTGVEALAVVDDVSPDALILDVNMPGVGGFEVLSSLRADAKTAHLPIVLLTARTQEADVLKGFSLGASDYITKPFNPMEFAARVARYLPGKEV